MAETSTLLKCRAPKGYRGFESPPLRPTPAPQRAGPASLVWVHPLAPAARGTGTAVVAAHPRPMTPDDAPAAFRFGPDDRLADVDPAGTGPFGSEDEAQRLDVWPVT